VPTEQDQVFTTRDKSEMDAFKHVFNSCFESLCQYACTIVKDMDEAEDIVQSVFLKIWEKRANLEIREIRSYLFKAVYHRCINELEHKTVRQHHMDYETKDSGQFVQQPEVFPSELEENIKIAINALPDQCRLIFMMSRYEELRYSEIAEKLGLSVNTIENQISKALKILRAKLKDNMI
jgi:RNA polymerase sigma-70 factor, ECF subfamily